METKEIQKIDGRETKGLTLLGKSILDPVQIEFMLGKTPPKHIYQRKAKGGGMWDYVTGNYVKAVLNYVFGWDWDFEVREHKRENDLIYVLGRLTVRKNDRIVVKEQFGRADVKYYKDRSKGTIDFGNDLKAATTDALKKCASELGIARDVYAKEEQKQAAEESRLPEDKSNTNYVKQIKEFLVNKKIKDHKKQKEFIEKETGMKCPKGIDGLSQRNAQLIFAKLMNK